MAQCQTAMVRQGLIGWTDRDYFMMYGGHCALAEMFGCQQRIEVITYQRGSIVIIGYLKFISKLSCAF